jgi:hypothetical protein
MFRSIVLLVASLTFLGAVSASAEDAVLGQKLGDGMHAYFAGDYTAAYEQFTAAIGTGSQDPRFFYFRGLTYLQLGRGDEAKADFKHGATLEANDANKFYDVPRSLERVQGSGRAQLETYRADARMVTLQQEEKARKTRYEALQREEQRVLRDKPVATPEETKAEAAPAAPAAPAGGAADPFAAPQKEEKADNAPLKADKKAADESPFAAENASGDKAKGDDPFGAPAAKEKAKKPAAKEKAAEEANPFAEEPAEKKKPAAKEKAAEESPFAEEPAVEKKPAAKGKAAKDKAADESPFAEEPAVEKKPAAKGKAAKEEPADDANPFMDDAANEKKPAAKEKPAAKGDAAADDNPFGDEPAKEEKKTPAKKAAKKTDKKADKKAADDDPFGG